MLFNWHKVNNVAQIPISNVKLSEGPERSSLFKPFHDQHQQFVLPLDIKVPLSLTGFIGF